VFEVFQFVAHELTLDDAQLRQGFLTNGRCNLEPEFEYSNLVITPSEAGAGDAVTFMVDVVNTGADVGSVNVELTINGEVVDSRTAILDVDEKRTVEFTHTESEAGEYSVQVGTESGTYTVTSGIPSLGIFISVIILVSAAFVSMRYRKRD